MLYYDARVLPHIVNHRLKYKLTTGQLTQRNDTITVDCSALKSFQWQMQEFPGGGGGGKCATRIAGVLIFCRKLHENERIWIPTVVTHLCRPLGSANGL